MKRWKTTLVIRKLQITQSLIISHHNKKKEDKCGEEIEKSELPWLVGKKGTVTINSLVIP